MTAESLAHQLEGRKVGATWMGKCPAHKDNNPSLAILEQDGKLLLKCHAGCEQQDVVAALKSRGLWPEATDRAPYQNGSGKNVPASKPPAKPATPAESARALLIREGWKLIAEYAFGEYLRSVRFEHPLRIDDKKGRPEKTYRWEHMERGKWYSGAGDLAKPLYFNALSKEGCFDSILGVEGPNKADAAGDLGMPAFSFKDLTEESAGELSKYSKVCLWPDKDKAGEKLVQAALTSIGVHVRDIRLIDPPETLPESGDIVDAIAAGMDEDGIKALMRDARRIRTGPSIRAISEVPRLNTFANRKIEWIIDELLAVGTIAVFSGDSGSGKSTLATAMLGAIAKGEPFAGRKTQQRQVLILDRENPLSVVHDRMERLHLMDGDAFRIWGGWNDEEPPAVNSPLILDWVKETNPKPVILVDSLVAFHPGNENDAGETRALFDTFRDVADRGATVVVIHHVGKGESSQDFRGTTDIKASIDSAYRIKNYGDGSRLTTLELKAWKLRVDITPLITVRYSDGSFLAQECEVPKSETERLCELLRRNPRVHKAAFEKLAADLYLGRQRARNYLDDGVKHGYVRAEKGINNSMLYSSIQDPNEPPEQGVL